MLRALMRYLPLPMLLAFCTYAPSARAEIKDRIAAVVNGTPITLSEVMERVGPELARAPVGPAGDSQHKALLKQGLDQLIDEHLVASEASSLGIEIADDEVQHLLESLAKQNNLEVPQFKEALAQQGISIDTVRDSLKRQQLMMRLLQYKVKPRKVSDAEVQQAYDTQNKNAEYEVHARDIYVAIKQGATPAEEAAAKVKAETAQRRVRAGESFALVARDLSDGPSAHEGGDLGYIHRGSMVVAIEQAAFSLEPGMVSDLIRLQSGYHLVLVEDRRRVAARPLPDVQEEIRKNLANDSIMRERERYLAQLRKTAQIEVML
jgi:peptidyl-prolyl cis-trans isomerase SurA